MAKFRKKPVVIDAWNTSKEFPPGCSIDQVEGTLTVYDYLHDTWVKFETGDWIIKGVNGEMYPCKPDVFEATYEPVDE